MKKGNCKICGREFTKRAKNQKICGDPECKKKRHRLYRYGTTGGKIRPYTTTSDMMILDDIAKDRSITWMAELYDRDVDDLINHIEKILSDGTADKIKRKIAAYQRSGVGW
jgi:hypothetical protein